MSNHLIKSPKDWYDEAYKFWVKAQNYKEVATKFGKSKSQIQRVASTFGWRQKYLELKKKDDEILAGQLNLTVGEIRKRAIKHLHQMSSWLKDLSFIHETLIREKREATAEEIAQMERLRKAINDFDPKDLRDMTMNLKENVHFNPPQGKVVIPPDGEDQPGVTVTGPTLIIIGPKEKKPVALQAKEIEDGKENKGSSEGSV